MHLHYDKTSVYIEYRARKIKFVKELGGGLLDQIHITVTPKVNH